MMRQTGICKGDGRFLECQIDVLLGWNLEHGVSLFDTIRFFTDFTSPFPPLFHELQLHWTLISHHHYSTGYSPSIASYRLAIVSY